MKLKLILFGLFAILLMGIVHAELGVNETALEITVDAKVDGSKSGTDLVDGDDLTKEPEPESTVKLTIELKNLYDKDTQNYDLEDITITATLEGIDDEGEEDIELEADISRVRPGRTSKKSFTYNIPLLVDEGNYNIQIDVDFDDENPDATRSSESMSLTLTVEKDKHKLIINKAELSKNDLGCKRQTKLNLRILNIGQEDEEEVKVTASNSELNLVFVDWQDGDIEIYSGIDDDSEYTKTISINAKDVDEGVYPILVKVYRDETKEEDSKTVELIVVECEEEPEEPEPEPQPQAFCGNSVVEIGEVCDDGNLFNGDGCSSACQVEQIIQPPVSFDEEEEQSFWAKYGVWVLGASTLVLVLLFIIILVVVLNTSKKEEY